MRFTLLDVSLPLLVAVGFFLLGLASLRPIYAGRELPGHMKKTLFYGFFFVLGMGYLMMLGSSFNWPEPLVFAAIGAWAILLGAIAWWRYRLSQVAGEKLRRSASTVLAEAVPALGLMISVIGGAAEWEYIYEGQGRWVGLLWIGSAIVFVLAARRNLRVTVILVIRGLFALLIIGAIAQRTTAAFIAAGVSGLVLLLLEKLWHGDAISNQR